MVSKEKLRELMQQHGMLTDFFDLDDEVFFGEQSRCGFVRDYIDLSSKESASDYTSLALDRANDEINARENLLNPEYMQSVKSHLVEIVLGEIEQSMIDILAEYQKQWHHM